MIFLYIAIISNCLYLLLNFIWHQHRNTIVVRNQVLFYILQWTWGIPANIIGGFAALILSLVYKIKPEKSGFCLCIPLNKNWGLSIGMFIFGAKSVLEHEHGHSFQNAVYGPFFLLIVALPSVIRFWYRELVYRFGNPAKLPDYDSIWFEGQATKSGNKFFDKGTA